MIAFTTLIVMAYLTWKKPLTGFAFFFLANTGAAGFLRMYGLVAEVYKLSNSEVILIIAIIVTLMRTRERNPAKWRYDTIGVCFFGMSCSVLIKAAITAIKHEPFIYPLADVVWWFPLYLAYVRMSFKERQSLINIIIYTSILTAILSIIIVLTHNDYLLRILGRITSPGEENYISARIIIDGAWTVMPVGYWLCLGEILYREKKHSIYIIGLLLIITATSFTITRSMVGTMLIGTLIAFLYTFPISVPVIQKRILYSFFFIIPCSILFLTFTPTKLVNAWSDRTNGKGEKVTGTLDMRIARDEFMWTRLKGGDAILWGMRSSDSGESETGGDPAAPFNIWWQYGLFASITYIILFTSIIMRLHKKARDKSRINIRASGILSVQLASMILGIVGMFSGFYFTPISTIIGTIGYAWCASNNYEITQDKDKNMSSNKRSPMRI